jgi:hypothetical protein
MPNVNSTNFVPSSPFSSMSSLPHFLATLPIRSTYIDYESCGWTAFFSSDLDGTMDCPKKEVVVGIDCQENFCSRMRLWCCDLHGTISGRGQAYYLEPLVTESEAIERHTTAWNPESNQFLTGMQCLGKHCDILKARSFSFAYGVMDISLVENAEQERETYDDGCEWTEWFKSGEMACTENRAIAGVDCTGIHCSKLKLKCCPFGRGA